MESTEMINGGGDHVVELVSNSNAALAEEIAPLLNDGDKPKINIFTLPYSRRQPKDLITKVVEADVSFFTRFVSWTWSGSMYSGVLCMVLSSVIYFVMEIILDVFSVQSIPLFETVFARCLIILVSSYIWLRRSAQSVFGPTHVRNLLLSRALMGCLSLFTFVYSIQSLPLSQAIVLNLTTPIMASIAARIFLHEKLKLVDIAGQTSSFFALLLIIQPMLSKQGGLAENGELNNKDIVRGNHSAYAVLLGLFSSLSGGISYCLIRAGAKASEQPVVTVFWFSLFACPAAAICTFALQTFVVPDLYTFFLMVVLGMLAFFAEVLLARALHLEKTSRAANMQYIEPFLSGILGILLSRLALSFSRIVGCLLILLSICSTVYFGTEKDVE